MRTRLVSNLFLRFVLGSIVVCGVVVYSTSEDTLAQESEEEAAAADMEGRQRAVGATTIVALPIVVPVLTYVAVMAAGSFFVRRQLAFVFSDGSSDSPRRWNMPTSEEEAYANVTDTRRKALQHLSELVAQPGVQEQLRNLSERMERDRQADAEAKEQVRQRVQEAIAEDERRFLDYVRSIADNKVALAALADEVKKEQAEAGSIFEITIDGQKKKFNRAAVMRVVELHGKLFESGDTSGVKMRITCPQCGTGLFAPRSAIGKKARCKKCHSAFVISEANSGE